MKGFVFSFCVTVFFVKTCHLSGLHPKEGICIISALVIQTTAFPSYFYEMMDDENFDDNAKYEVLHTTYKTIVFKPTTTTTEQTIQDEWRLRGEFRILCVDEVAVDPKKIVKLMSIGDWQEDADVKLWVLCVLNKMNLMSKEGVFRLDVALAKIRNKDKEDAESLIDHCLPKKEMKPQDIAWQYVKCHSKSKGNFSAISVF